MNFIVKNYSADILFTFKLERRKKATSPFLFHTICLGLHGPKLKYVQTYHDFKRTNFVIVCNKERGMNHVL